MCIRDRVFPANTRIVAFIGRIEADDVSTARRQKLQKGALSATDLNQRLKPERPFDNGRDLFQMIVENRACALIVLIELVIVHDFGTECRVVNQPGFQIFHDAQIAARAVARLLAAFIHALLKGGETALLKDGSTIHDTQSSLVLEDLIGKFLLNTVNKDAK